MSWFKKEHGKSESADSHDDNETIHDGGTLPRDQTLHYNLMGKSSSKGSSG